MLDGTFIQAQYEKQVKAADFVNQIRLFLSDYSMANDVLKKQNNSAIENTTKLQESVQSLITSAEGVSSTLTDIKSQQDKLRERPKLKVKEVPKLHLEQDKTVST